MRRRMNRTTVAAGAAALVVAVAGSRWGATTADSVVAPTRVKSNSAGLAPGHTYADAKGTTPRLITRPANYGTPISALAFSPDGRWLISGSKEKALRFWDAQTGRLARTCKVNSGILALAVSSNSRFVVTAGYGGGVQIWGVTNGGSRAVLGNHHNWVKAVAFSPDGKTIASGAIDGSLKLWDTATGNPLRTMQAGSSMHSLSYSGDGTMLAAALFCKHEVAIWKMPVGKLLRVLKPGAQVETVAFSPADGTLATGSGIAMLTEPVRDVTVGTINFWNAATGRQVGRMRGHHWYVHPLAYSPDGRYLLTGGDDGKVKLWDAKAARLKWSVQNHFGSSDGVTSVAFSPNGRLVASAGGGVIKLWSVETGHLALTMRILPPRKTYAISQNWITSTPGGYYDGLTDNEASLAWRVGIKTRPFATLKPFLHRPQSVRRALS